MANPIVPRRGAQIGQPDAEGDDDYLFSCFVDNGLYDEATNTNNSGSILLGRTGSGKSALIRIIQDRQENVILLSPETLSLNFVANSQVLNFFEASGVHLDAFYVLLWKHIFVVELLKRKYHINNEDSQKGFFSSISNIFVKDKAKERALSYLQQWGEKFWIETDYRIKEFTSRLEQKLEGDVGVDIAKVRAGAKGAASLTEEQKLEVQHRGQRAVNDVQIKELHEVIRLLSEDIFAEKQDRYYICIDKLDENWVDDGILFKLLKALVETVRAFRQIRPLKIIIALRTDLYFTMTQRTTSAGFQEEKFSGYYINIRWTRQQLFDLLDKRVNQLYQRKYTRNNVKLSDLLPANQIEKSSASDYILDRTFFRPREAISFVNKCLEKTEDRVRMTVQIIRDAETTYSYERLNSVYDEWRREYPYLSDLLGLVRGGHSEVKIKEFTVPAIEIFSLKFYGSQFLPMNSNLKALAESAAMDASKHGVPFLQHVISVMYQVGILGVKLLPNSARMWSFQDRSVIDPAEVGEDAMIYVHKAFHRSLAVTYDKSRASS